MKILRRDHSLLDGGHPAASSRNQRGVTAILTLCAFVVTLAALVLTFTAKRANGQAPATKDSKAAKAPAGNAQHGKQLFRNYGCYECHGSQGQIASRAGTAIALDLVEFDEFVSYVHHPAGSMPPYTERVVSDQDLGDIYVFLQSVPRSPLPKSIPLLN